MEVKNSVDRTEKSTAGSTDKKNPHEHGMGLQNVGDVVQRYNGVLQIQKRSGMNYGITSEGTMCLI